MYSACIPDVLEVNEDMIRVGMDGSLAMPMNSLVLKLLS